MAHPIVSVIGDKGGIGKTTIATELAASLGAVLVDLDWSGGGATRAWGVRDDERAFRAFLKTKNGKPPTARRAPYRPDLLPSYPGLEAIRQEVAIHKLKLWAEEWDRPVVVDTHPGMNSLTLAAVNVADLIVVPVVLAVREMNALEQMLEMRLADLPILLVPNRVPRVLRERDLARLKALLLPYEGLPVSPPISFHSWWPRRQLRSALVLHPKPGRDVQFARAELERVATAVRERLAADA